MQEGGEMTVRAAVATLLGQLAKQPLHGPRVALLLGRLLPPGLVAAIQARPLHAHGLLPPNRPGAVL
jgi:DnaJ family protein C protein 13